MVTSAAHFATMFHAKIAIKKQIIDISHIIDLLNEFIFYIIKYFREKYVLREIYLREKYFQIEKISSCVGTYTFKL